MIKVKMSQAVEEFIGFTTARRKSANTIRAYRNALLPLIQTTGDIYVCNLTADHVERHFTKHSHWGASTRNTKLQQIGMFLKWCDNRGYKAKDVDLLWGWDNVKVPSIDRTRIPQHEWVRLFNACEHPTDTATVAVGLYLFLRVSEARALKVGDVHLDRGTVSVFRTKTQEFDEMPMSSELEAILRDYLSWYSSHMQSRGRAVEPSYVLLPPRATSDQEWLRDAAFEAPLRVTQMHSALGLRIKKVIERAGYEMSEQEKPGGWGGHVLRRSGARALFDELVTQGYDGALKTVQAMLGHKNSIMTERYLGLSLDKEKRNTLISGRPMFKNPASQNVITLRREA